MSTKTDPTSTGWEITDKLVRFRCYGTERTFDLPSAASWTIGAASDCTIRLDDPSGRISRHHARAERAGDAWLITDLGSTNGMRVDGEDRRSFLLSPGVEVELGGLKLIAESARSIGLCELLRRYVGWSPTRLAEADDALRSVRNMANLRATLLVLGQGSMLGFARRVHHATLGDGRPFAIHDPDEDGVAAMNRALGGTLYVGAEKLPGDFDRMVASLRLPDMKVRLIVHASTPKLASQFSALIRHAATIWIPPLSERVNELERVLTAYAFDAARQLGATEVSLRPHDLQWVQQGGMLKTHKDADEVMQRLVAERNWGVAGGAARVGITHGAMSRYLRKRGIPT